MDNIIFNKVVVSKKVSFGKKDPIFRLYRCEKIEIEKIDLYPYSFQKWVHIEKILIKLNLCVFWYKSKIIGKI